MENEQKPGEDPSAEALRRVYDPNTFTTPFRPMTEVYTLPLHLANIDDSMTEVGIEEIELESFLRTFSVREKTEEIVEIMCHTPRLKELFEELVPTVISYPDFWTRFYFRCDPDRIRRIRCCPLNPSSSPDQEVEEAEPEDNKEMPPKSTPSMSSPTSVLEHFELDGLEVLRNLSLEGL